MAVRSPGPDVSVTGGLPPLVSTRRTGSHTSPSGSRPSSSLERTTRASRRPVRRVTDLPAFERYLSAVRRVVSVTGRGTVERVFVAPTAEADMRERDEVEAVAGSGLRGDRYFSEIETGTFIEWEPDEKRHDGYDLTLIEQEAIAAIERDAGIALAPGEHRRNVETRDVALNHLVGRRFRVGNAVCRVDRLCEPCSHLEGLTQDGVVSALTHRGGLRADVLEDGVIGPGDVIEPLE